MVVIEKLGYLDILDLALDSVDSVFGDDVIVVYSDVVSRNEGIIGKFVGACGKLEVADWVLENVASVLETVDSVLDGVNMPVVYSDVVSIFEGPMGKYVVVEE